MRIGLGAELGALVLALAAAPAVRAQSPAPALAPAASLAPGEIVREICDPHTGGRWLLLRSDASPGGPGRLVLVAGQPGPPARAADTGEQPASWSQPASRAKRARLHPVIHAGDRLIVEEHTTVADAALEARAMSPAAAGSALNVRLTIGGKVVRAVALAAGRALLQPQTGVWQ